MIKFANIYGNNMVFQQGEPVIIWGYCDNSSKILIQWLEEDYCIAESIVYAEGGKWKAEFQPFEVKRDLTIRIKNLEEELVLSNVAIGEVWLCSGQSNIECDFGYCTGTERYIDKFAQYDIRFMDIEPMISFEKKENAENVRWVKVNRETILPLSVVSCIFGQCIGEKLNIPIGLVKNYRGGNSVISFLPEEIFRDREEYAFFVERFEAEKKKLKSAWSMIPAAFYNAMTVPLQVFRFKGVLWYQGETDSSYERSQYYKPLMKHLIAHWREIFKNEELPVVLVQLCPFEQEPFDYKLIRQIQLEISQEISNVYLVVTADLGPTGEEGESAIHPKYKTPIGERCAMAALNEVYNINTDEEWSGPIIKSAHREGEDLILIFDHCGAGLQAEGRVKGFEIDKKNGFFVDYVSAVEIILPDKVVIRNASDAEAVRYCYANTVIGKSLGGNLTNTTGIPASPFIVTISKEMM